MRDEADIIITNPPFSLFREFLAWIMEANKQFSIIGNMNAITYKEVFPLIASNQIWLGNGFQAGNAYFESAVRRQYAEGVYDQEAGLVKFRNCHWFTNIEHGRRHQPLPLMTMEQNLKFSKHKEIRGKDHYEHYDNYNAIEVPYTDAIPSDYDGVMGVPISFLDKYCPEQFEIVAFRKGDDGRDLVYTISPNELDSTHTHTYIHHTSEFWSSTLRHPAANGERAYVNGRRMYARVLIRHCNPWDDKER